MAAEVRLLQLLLGPRCAGKAPGAAAAAALGALGWQR